MDFRTAFPAALLLGSVFGAAVVGDRGPDGSPSASGSALVALADAATPGATWDIPVVRNAPVQRFVDLFEGRQSDRMALYLKRSGRYEGMIRAKLRARGMPEDLVYLSMIESGFNPNAKSTASAVGLWQFIEDTGERYGLRVDSYVDERRDPEKSTDAALRYLDDLHGQFGSWYLAAAAYNTGEGRVARVMKQVTGKQQGKDVDFWRIRSRLPRETREYVPLMVAAALIGKEPHKYGHGDVPRWLPLEMETVMVPAGTHLSTVAEAAGTGLDELTKLNPHLVRKTTPPGKDAYPVRIPRGSGPRYAAGIEGARAAAAERARVAAAAEAKRVAERRAEARRTAARRAASTRTHTVRRGESLWTIARRNDTSVAALRRANGMGARSAIRPGQRLRIPR